MHSGVVRGVRRGPNAPGGTCPEGGIFGFKKAAIEAVFLVHKSNSKGGISG